jgi:KaiC/GvpD/RAD55 family RecA-like ATPase
VIEAKVIAAAMNSRPAYDRVAPFMDEKDFSPPGQFWWKLIGEWYAKDVQSQYVDTAALADLGSSRSSGKQRDAVTGFLSDLGSIVDSVSAPNIASVALELKRHNVGLELAAAIAGGDDKKQRLLTPLFAELQQATELSGKKKAVSYEWAPSVDELYSIVGDENRIPLAPTRLNTRIDGGALPSTHILLFARPEMGKSTFAINFAVQLAKQDKRVLYISNEDAVAKLKQRAVARGTGMTVREATVERREAAIQAYKERGLDERLGFVKMTHATVQDLRRPIEEFAPSVIILDQIRNLAGAEETVKRLDENGQRFRELLGEYQLVGLSIAQASASAEYKTWLGMDDLDSSKTGLPASADLMISLGANEEMLARNHRALAIQKNKLSAEANAKEGLEIEMDLTRVSVK